MKSIYILLLMLVSSAVTVRAQQPTESLRPNIQPKVAQNKKVCVLGIVMKPSEVSFTNRLTVTQALKESGGILLSNKSVEVRVFSQMSKGEMRVIYVDLKAIEKKPYMDLELQDYDIVEIVPRKREKRIPKLPINPCPSMIPDSMLRGSRM